MLGNGLSHDMAVFDNSLIINKLALCGWVNFEAAEKVLL